MNVQIIAHTPEPEKIIASAAKLCYSSAADINTLMDGLTPEKTHEFIEKLMSLGHESPLEHVSFTFAIEGISRSLSHQLVRHRIASYSQRSQRYVSEKGFEYFTPQSIITSNIGIRSNSSQFTDDDIMSLEEAYDSLMGTISNFYNALIDAGIPREDARYILPNSCTTKIIVTMNLRSLLHFFNERCCNRAQEEIRNMANSMLYQCRKISPLLFENAGAKCDKLGYCPEGSMCCGRRKTLEQLKNKE